MSARNGGWSACCFELNASKPWDSVAGGVAHDFNNLLTVMIGYTAILRRRLAGQQGSGEVDQLEIAVDRAADLTRNLLGFAGDSSSRR